VGVAVDPGDPDTVIVSRNRWPRVSLFARRAEAYVYRKTGLKAMGAGIERPAGGKGHDGGPVRHSCWRPGVIYAANNHGLFRSDDAGRRWKALDLPWPEPGLEDGVEALACLPK